MATTRGKGTRKANSGPEVQHLGSKKGGGAQKKSTIVEKETHHSEHQSSPPKASLEQPQKDCGHPRKVTAVDVPTIHEDQDPAPIEDLPRQYFLFLHRFRRNPPESAGIVRNSGIPPESVGIRRNQPESTGIDLYFSIKGII